LSFVKLTHTQSKEFKNNWGGRNEPGMPEGTMFLSRDHQVLPIGTPIILLLRTIKYIYWIGRPGDGRMEFQTDNKQDQRICKINGLEFLKDERTGKPKAPLVTTYYNFYCVTPYNLEEPSILSFYRKSMPLGKKLIQDLARLTRMGQLPMYLWLYKLGKPGIAVDGQNTWPQFNLEPAGATDPNILEKIEKVHGVAELFAQASTGAEMGQLEEEGGTTIEGSSEQVPAAPAPPSASPLKQAQAAPTSFAAPAPIQTQTPASFAAPVTSQPAVAQQQTPVQGQATARLF